MSQLNNPTANGDVFQWIQVAGAVMMVAAGMAWNRLSKKDKTIEKPTKERNGSSVEQEQEGRRSAEGAGSEATGRVVEDVTFEGGMGECPEITDMSERNMLEQVISKWTREAEEKQVEKRRAEIEQERIKQHEFEQEMAERIKRNVAEGTIERWKAMTVEKSMVEREDKAERGQRLAKWVAKRWQMKTAESSLRERRQRLEERRIQEERHEEEMAEKRRQKSAECVAKAWYKITTGNRWKHEEKKKREMLEDAIAKGRRKRMQSVEKGREEERKRVAEYENIPRQGESNTQGLSARAPEELPIILTPEKALESCRKLREEELLSRLNACLGTEYTIDISEDASEALQLCISQNYDFGTAYGLLRGTWKQLNCPEVERPRLKDRLDLEKIENRRLQQDLQYLKQDMSEQLVIASPFSIRPRRVWDLRSHRVIPWESADLETPNLWAISHSWVKESERHMVKTAVNGYEWPIPVPCGVTLEAVRNELLRYGAEYCWLDVLCLRQDAESGAKGPTEQMRAIEWAIDVPTIGNVYFGDLKVLRYYNGLGRPFKTSGWESEFHWTNRAWTLQESKRGSITGGTPDGYTNKQSVVVIEDGRYEGMNKEEFEHSKSYTGISELLEIRAPAHFLRQGDAPLKVIRTACGLFGVLREMQHRNARRDVDKVAAIGFLMSNPKVTIPAFWENIDIETAWTRCVRHMTPTMRDELLFRYPEPGDQNHLWFPSWTQIRDHELPEDPVGPFCYRDKGGSCTSPNSTTYKYFGYVIAAADITGLGISTGGKRSGILTVEREGQSSVQFLVSAYHKHPIPDGRYSLVRRMESHDFVVCSYSDRARHHSFVDLDKVSVLCVEFDESKFKQAGAILRSCKFI